MVLQVPGKVLPYFPTATTCVIFFFTNCGFRYRLDAAANFISEKNSTLLSIKSSFRSFELRHCEWQFRRRRFLTSANASVSVKKEAKNFRGRNGVKSKNHWSHQPRLTWLWLEDHWNKKVAWKLKIYLWTQVSIDFCLKKKNLLKVFQRQFVNTTIQTQQVTWTQQQQHQQQQQQH